MSGESGGTPQFMPPEQVLDFRAAKPAADQYSAAATFYFVLTGKPHYEPTQQLHDIYKRILQEEPVRIESRRADVPAELADIIHQALEREPGQRFADVREMQRALDRLGENADENELPCACEFYIHAHAHPPLRNDLPCAWANGSREHTKRAAGLVPADPWRQPPPGQARRLAGRFAMAGSLASSTYRPAQLGMH